MNRSHREVFFRNCLILGLRDQVDSLLNPYFYAIVSLGLLIGLFFLRNQIAELSDQGILVLDEPIILPLIIVVLVSGVYTAFNLAFTIAREKESGTMACLFFGPINEGTFIVGQLIKHALTLMVGLLTGVVILACMAVYFHLPVSNLAIMAIALGFIFGLCLETISALIAVFLGKTRTVMYVFGLCFGIFFGLHFGVILLRGMENPGGVMVYIKDFLEILLKLTKYISPFSYFLTGIEGLQLGQAKLVLSSLFASVSYIGVVSWIAIRVLRWKGVR